MASYNTSGVTRPRARPQGKPSSRFDSKGSIGLGSRPSPQGGRGDGNREVARRRADFTSVGPIDDGNDKPSFMSRVASTFSSFGANIPSVSDKKDKPNGRTLYDRKEFQSPLATIPDNTSEVQAYLGRASVEDAMRDALGMAPLQKAYVPVMPKEEPEPNIDMSVLQGALQPEPITIKELTVKTGDTLSDIANTQDIPLQALIDANPQITNPDMIRPGEKVSVPDPRNLGGAEGYGSLGTPPADAGLMTRPKARPDNAPVVTSNRTPVKVAVDTTTTSSNVKKIQQALTTMGFKPNGVDGAMGGGTARALRKFQAANDLPITGKLTQEVADLLTNGTSITYPDRPVPFAVPEDIEDNLFDIFKVEVGYIESKNKYNIKGGSGNHYDGRYQMGEAAKKDAGRALGVSLKHDAASRKAFREDSALQDKAFKAYTEMNHTHLTRNSEKYRNMSVEEKLGILGYAHNQGATAAEEYLFTGIVGTDANDTKGTRYTDAIAKALGN